MPENNIKNDDRKTYWYLMSHRKPELIDMQLREVNNNRIKAGVKKIEYLLPASYLSRISRPSNAKDRDDGKGSHQKAQKAVRRKKKERFSDVDLNNSLHNYLRYFVFMKSCKSELDSLVGEEWNRDRLYQLSFRYSHDHLPLRMSEEEMQQLMAIVADYHYRFTLVDFRKVKKTNMKVRMKNENYHHQIGTVLNFTGDDENIKLTIGIPAFNNEVIMEIRGVGLQDVEMIGGDINETLKPYLGLSVEKDMIQILRNRILRREESFSRAKEKKRLETYSDMLDMMEFTEENQTLHLLSLKLLNACLMGVSDVKKKLVERAKGALHLAHGPSSDEEAFLFSMLFVATRKGIYRMAVKDYVRKNDPNMKSLLSMMPILKEIQTR